MSTGTVEPHDSAAGREPAGAGSDPADSTAGSAPEAGADTSAATASGASAPGTTAPGASAPGAAAESAPAQLRILGTWMMIRGLLGTVFGLAMVFWPREQLGSPANLGIPVVTVDRLLIAYLAAAGVLALVHGLRTQSALRTPLLGQAIVVVPALIFLLIASTATELRAAVAVWALLHGLLELWIWRQQQGQHMRSDFLISGGVHVLLGIIAFAGSGMAALAVFGFVGAAAIIAGVFFLVGGYARRSLSRQRS